MLKLPYVRINGTTRPEPETRQRMIRQTNAFLTVALSGGMNVPRIPRRRMDQGGFTTLMRLPGGRAMAERVWQRLLDLV